MKKTISLLLVLLVGCSGSVAGPVPSSASSEPPPVRTDTPTADTGTTGPETAEPETVSTETEAPEPPALFGMEVLLAGDCLLFFRQDQLLNGSLSAEHRGDALTLEELHAWHEAQTCLPRTHFYDDAFTELPLLQEMMDYLLCEGYAGVTVPIALMDLRKVTEDQWLKLAWTYRIDQATRYCALLPDAKGNYWCNALWLRCENPESFDRFHIALEKAREIVAEIPEGLDAYDRAQ